MKWTIATVAALVVVLSAGAVPTLEPGPARIRLTGVQVEHRLTAAGHARTFALHNRPAYPDRLGIAVVTCNGVARGWVDCTYLLRLSRGSIIARGLVPAAAGFRLLAIVGGTGFYANSGGEMTAQPLGRGQLMLINLLGY